MKLFLFGLVVLVVAIILRYLPGLGRFGLTFTLGGVARGVSMNQVGFWLVLAVGGVVILVKLIALITGRAHK